VRCKCGGKALVINTKRYMEWTRRQLKCQLCKQNFYTAEKFLKFVQPLYTEAEATAVKKRAVNIRRQIEDRENAKRREIY